MQSYVWSIHLPLCVIIIGCLYERERNFSLIQFKVWKQSTFFSALRSEAAFTRAISTAAVFAARSLEIH